MITQPEDYFAQGCGRCSRFATPACSSQTWAAGLQALRQLCLGVGLVETAKWGHPCYTHQGRNIAILGALRGDFRLTFFNASLLQDPQQLLQRKGANSAHPDTLSFTDVTQVKAVATPLRAYLQEAMALAEKGINIQVISTSEIKISVLVAEEYTELAVRALHTAYGLDTD